MSLKRMAIGSARLSISVAGLTSPAVRRVSYSPRGLRPKRPTYEVALKKRGYQTALLSVTSPMAGEVITETAVLHRLPPPGSVRVRLADDEDHPIQEAGFGFFAADDDGLEPSLVVNDDSESGVYELDGIPAGNYVVTIHPEGQWRNYISLIVSDSFEVGMESGKTTDAGEQILQRGGRAQFRIRNERGEVLPAECELRGKDGRPVAVEFRYLDIERNTL